MTTGPLWTPDGLDVVVHGDNLAATAQLPSGAFRLIYLDPPFNTGRTQVRETVRTPGAPASGTAASSAAAAASVDESVAGVAGDDARPARLARPRIGFKGLAYGEVRERVTSYDDAFDDYWGFLEPRLEEAWRLLAPDGTLYLHLDYREAHYAKVLLDALFGRASFLNELIWAYDYGARTRKRWPSKHDTILVYVKDPRRYVFDADTVDREPYMAPGLVTPEKAARGKLPTDVWWHTIVSPTGREKTGYPTQKPEGVLRRIVQASSEPGDWVLDFFAGSGTTGAVARRLGRRFVLVDEHPEAIATMRTRLGALPGAEVAFRELDGARAAGPPASVRATTRDAGAGSAGDARVGTVGAVTDRDLAAQANDPSFENVYDELEWRGYIHVSTDAEALRAALGGEPITYYIGFDPTAPSLHLGHLVQLLLMRRMQLAGHRPLGLVGGSTGLVGDPRPTAERTLNSRETVAAWVEGLRGQIGRYLSFEGDNAARMVNNLDWTAPLSAIDFLREIGKHFRVGTMLKKDAVAARLNSDAGISYTEFSYQILQALDFLELHRQYDCAMQMGGSDQWGNLTAGVDLIRRVEGTSVHALGTPLITNSDGTKFGKSEGNAIWIDGAMTSPYAFYQFWLNTDDADVIARLKVFTFRTRDEIAEFERLVAEEPFRRAAQKALAREVTALVHGAAATDAAIAASEALFGQGELGSLDADTLSAAVDELPNAQATPGTSVAQALVDTGLASSLGEARRAISQGGVSLNNVKVTDEHAELAGEHALPGGVAIVRRGKKTLAGVRLSS